MATVNVTVGDPRILASSVNGSYVPWYVFDVNDKYVSGNTYRLANDSFKIEFNEIKICAKGASPHEAESMFLADDKYYHFYLQTESYYVVETQKINGDTIYFGGGTVNDSTKGERASAVVAYGIALYFTQNDKYAYLRSLLNPLLAEYNVDDLAVKPTTSSKGNIGNNRYTPVTLNHPSTTPSHDALCDEILHHAHAYNPDNPYENVGDEPDDPGQGDFDYSSDDVPIPDLPKTNVTDSGLVSLFAPDEGQLRQLAKFLWSDNFSLDSFKKIFNNPMDCILGLSILPIHLPHGEAKEITVGNIVSTVSCDVCGEQYVKLNCGSFTFSRSRFTGGYLDNAPYTRCYLYLPFIGTQEINIDEFMGATLGVEYHIDILTGAMFCFVTRNGKLLLTYSGNCAENVPLSANDFTSTISSMLSMATVGAGAIATIATAGAAAPTTAGMASEALGARTASSLIGAGAQGASAVMNSKPNVSHSGSLGGGAGAMGQLYPYLIFIAPRPDIPTDQNMYTGFPSNDIVQIGKLKDFNVIEAVNLKVEGANDTEMSEIEAILKGGVII